MLINDGAGLSDTAGLRKQLGCLVAMAPCKSIFVSCYLDMRVSGKDRGRFLDDQAAAWRERLPHAAWRQVEASLRRIRAEMARPWQRDIRGLAVFVTRHVSRSVATASEMANRLNVYDRPDVVPLIDLLQRERPHWPIEVKARRITRAALKAVPDVVAGAAASEAMLRAGLVKTLLVVPDLVCTAGSDWPSCAKRFDDSAPLSRRPCIDEILQDIHQPLTDLVHMASQRGIEVLVSRSDELHELGGVACLLAEPAEYHLMPAPTSAVTAQPMGLAA